MISTDEQSKFHKLLQQTDTQEIAKTKASNPLFIIYMEKVVHPVLLYVFILCYNFV